MAKRRTRKQKQKTKDRLTFEVKQVENKKEPKPVTKEEIGQTNVIVKDLMKTVWVSMILFGLLGLAYLKLR